MSRGVTVPGPPAAARCVELLEQLDELVCAVEAATTESELLARSMRAHGALGVHVPVWVHLVPDGPADVGDLPADRTVLAPIVGGGEVLGYLVAPADRSLDQEAVAASELWGRLVGGGLARLRRERQERVAEEGRSRATDVVAHRLRNVAGTVGVAASLLRTRGQVLGADVHDQLLQDIEASVAVLATATDELLETNRRAVGAER
jgi:hypothetical protein